MAESSSSEKPSPLLLLLLLQEKGSSLDLTPHTHRSVTYVLSVEMVERTLLLTCSQMCVTQGGVKLRVFRKTISFCFCWCPKIDRAKPQFACYFFIFACVGDHMLARRNTESSRTACVCLWASLVEALYGYRKLRSEIKDLHV